MIYWMKHWRMPMYKFNEGALIQELQQYIDATYEGHYSKNKFQSTEFIIDCGHGMGFALGNVLKYAQRYGKKDGANRKDLMKILHYAIIAMHQHDLNEKENELPEQERAECDFASWPVPIQYKYKFKHGAKSETK